MRIAFVVGSLAGGGAERVVSVLASNIAANGNTVKIILIAENKIMYPVNDLVEIADCTKRSSIPGLNFINRVGMIKKEIDDFRADITVSFTVGVNVYVILSCIFSKRKIVVCERNDPRFDPVDRKSRFMRKMLYGFADGYVFQTTGERDFFSKNIRDKSVVIPNPLSNNLPEPFVGVRSKRIVSAGRLQKQKNYHMAIKAFSLFHEKYPNYTYEIYGGGQLKDELQSFAIACGVGESVIFKGTTQTLFTDILDASAFILSSDYEGLSNSMIEAMALGIPTISTDYPSGGARDFIINDENGIIVECGNPNQLAEAIEKVCSSELFQRKISVEATKIRNSLNTNQIVIRWMEYFQQITKC